MDETIRAAFVADPVALDRADALDALAVAPALRLTTWPGGEDRLLANTGPHGASVTWYG